MVGFWRSDDSIQLIQFRTGDVIIVWPEEEIPSYVHPDDVTGVVLIPVDEPEVSDEGNAPFLHWINVIRSIDTAVQGEGRTEPVRGFLEQLLSHQYQHFLKRMK